MNEPVIQNFSLKPRKLKAELSMQSSPIDRELSGKNRAYGVPEFLVRLADLRRMSQSAAACALQHRHD